MAPLTRSRAVPDTRVPTPLQAEYYVQRASAGLIISEATSVSPMGVGYAATPGIWSDEQTAGWKKITKAVHDAGGRMVLQLWHVGRVSHPVFLNGATPVSASAVKPKGHVSLVRPETDYVTPRALQLSELPDIIAAFKRGAENAMKAGFDGVHIHGANGYLLDQFLQDSTNRRSDAYGGADREPRPADAGGHRRLHRRVGRRPCRHASGAAHGCSTTWATATGWALSCYVARELGRRKLGWIAAREARMGPDTKLVDSQGRPRESAHKDSISPAIKQAFGGPFIANEGFDQASAERALAEGFADAVAFGKLFIANPDLPRRFKEHAPLNAWDTATFYSGGVQGYTDYPA